MVDIERHRSLYAGADIEEAMTDFLLACAAYATGFAIFIAGLTLLSYLICPCGYYASIGG